MTSGSSILLAICVTSLGAGCASGGQFSSNALQSSTSGQRAGPIPGSWDKVTGLRPDSRVVVTLMDGERVEAVFRTLGPGDVSLTDSAGREFGVARSSIRQIVARGERDDLKNGALIGAG